MATTLTFQKLQQLHQMPAMNTKPIEAVLEPHEMPELSPTPLGRYRLLMALRNKYGPTYRNNTQVSGALDHFDGEVKYFQRLRELKGLGGS